MITKKKYNFTTLKAKHLCVYLCEYAHTHNYKHTHTTVLFLPKMKIQRNPPHSGHLNLK